MIRFIDIGDQILKGYREFAWWNTVIDKFEEFADTQTWNNWKDFETDYLADGQREAIQDVRPLSRYKGLFPDWWPEQDYL